MPEAIHTRPGRRRRRPSAVFASSASVLLAAGCLVLTPAAQAAGDGARDLTVEQTAVHSVQAPAPAATASGRLSVTAWVDQADNTYAVGEKVRLFVKPSKDAYVTVLNVGPSGQTTMLFPNAHQKDNKVPGNQAVEIPSAASGGEHQGGGSRGPRAHQGGRVHQPGPALPRGEDEECRPLRDRRGRRAIRGAGPASHDGYPGEPGVGRLQQGHHHRHQPLRGASHVRNHPQPRGASAASGGGSPHRPAERRRIRILRPAGRRVPCPGAGGAGPGRRPRRARPHRRTDRPLHRPGSGARRRGVGPARRRRLGGPRRQHLRGGRNGPPVRKGEQGRLPCRAQRRRLGADHDPVPERPPAGSPGSGEPGRGGLASGVGRTHPGKRPDRP